MADKVLVAMSGGVDSSVSVKLLLDEGYDVAGATMRLYSNEDIGLDKTRTCCSPLLIVWLGANVRTIIVSGMSVALFGSVINLYTGFRGADPEKLKLIRTLGGTKKDELTKIVLPSSVPLILSIMKVNIGLCLVGVVIGEFIGARCGLGYLIIYGSQTFKLTWVLMSIVILCVIAMVLYAMLDLIEKYTLKK